MIKVRFRNAIGKVVHEQQLESFPVSIGRDSSCSIVLSAGGVSGRHAEIECDGYWLTVRDLGSRNGTFVGKEKINSTKLKLPCAILLGIDITMEVESSAVAGGAVAVRASVMPRALKRPDTPHHNMPVMPDPRPAVRSVVIDDAEVMEGWECYWHLLKKASPRPVLLFMIGLATLYFFMHYAVFRESFFFSLGAGFGAAVVCAIAAAALAGLLALPGILFRGAYDFKPLFIMYCVCMMLMTLQVSVLRPAMLMEYFGYVAKLLSLPLIIVSCVLSAYVFLFTTFSHKHAKKLACLTAIFAVLGIFSESKKVFSVDRQALMREALMGEFRSARGLAGSSTDVKNVTEDIRTFGHTIK